MARKHQVDEVLKVLNRKHDVSIDNRDKVIRVLCDKVFNLKTGKTEINAKKTFDLGNGSWGKISFLVNHCGYQQFFVTSF